VAASVEVCRQAYREILRAARRHAGSDEDARDLAQDALVIALARGFEDWSAPGRRGWLRGVVRKRAAFVIRGQARRRRREGLVDGASGAGARRWVWEADFLASLPRSLRAVAVLASADLCAAEIQWLLGLSSTALRQRLSGLRRAVRAEAEPPTLTSSEPPALSGGLRAQLLAGVRRHQGRVVATHDPDGHVILLRPGPHKNGLGGNPWAKELSCPSSA
jgi:DNA-directed RNA polymerase specialized sigma24 family protein